MLWKSSSPDSGAQGYLRICISANYTKKLPLTKIGGNS
jgi:hypothetical protein